MVGGPSGGRCEAHYLPQRVAPGSREEPLQIRALGFLSLASPPLPAHRRWLPARKPGESRGKDDDQHCDGGRDRNADTLDEIGVRRGQDGRLHGGVGVPDRPARSDLRGVGARVGAGDYVGHDVTALGCVRDRGDEIAVERRAEPRGENRAKTAKPTVDPIARCALMIPDAMPARSGGTADIASDVIGVRQRAPPAPERARPRIVTGGNPCMPTTSVANPATITTNPTRIGNRAPTLPTRRPATRDTMVIATLYGSSMGPVITGV